MDIQTLRNTPRADNLASPHLRALWHDLHGDWDGAHTIVQALNDPHAMWIHAYLHRKEPDISNAKYWYQRCGQPYPGDIPYDDEAAIILNALL